LGWEPEYKPEKFPFLFLFSFFTCFITLFYFFISLHFVAMETLAEWVEPTLLKLENIIRAIAAEVPTETDWEESSFGSW
jgi:hypothetical protein